MAIFVSNPTSPAVPAPNGDALDPSAALPNEGFTEELAAAMQPSEPVCDASAKSTSELLAASDKRQKDLQILPAEVLMNAVGDANFALAAQANSANATAQITLTVSAATDIPETSDKDKTPLEGVNPLQGAELAAANLAAQMSAPMGTVPETSMPNSAEVAVAMPVSATSQSGQNALQVSQQQGMGPSLQKVELVSSASTLAAAPNTQPLVTESIRSTKAPKSQIAQQGGVTLAESNATPLASGNTTPIQTSLNAPSITAAPINITPESTQAASTLTLATSPETNALKVNAPSDSSVASVAAQIVATAPVEMPQQNNTPSSGNAASLSNAGIAPQSSSTLNALETDEPSQPVDIAQLVSAKNTDDGSADAATQATKIQDSAFNFDAKLAKTDALQNSKAAEGAISLAGNAKTDAQVQNESLTSNETPLGTQSIGANSTSLKISAETNTDYASVSSTSKVEAGSTSFSNVQSGLRSSQKGEVFQVNASSTSATTPSSNRMESAAIAATQTAATPTPETPRAEVAQSLEDISSSFVSSLVGGPQRPVNTVMDWISTQSQERPSPVVPHEVRLDAGAVQLEIQKMVKQGGGHVVMELTPPDQSKFTIELKLDERGGALLIVEGVSDSTKTRLEQSAPQLREQFQQMGLELQLDMRQQGQSASSGSADFSGFQERGFAAQNLSGSDTGNSANLLTQRELGATRARETGSHQVYLYA